tara:strand:+ start:4423 stop:8286 length:3864 start_codon:yes stop_codon:yes gene_type:complete
MNTKTTTTAKNSNQKQISALNMRVINTDVVGRKNKTTLRKFFKTNYNLKTFNDLLAFVIAFGVDVGKRKKTQEKRTFQYLAEIYNDEVIASQKIKRAIKKQTKKAVGKYVNIVINFSGYALKQKNKAFKENHNPLYKSKGGKFTDEEVKKIKADNIINAVEGEVEKKIIKKGVLENIETLFNTESNITDSENAVFISIAGYKLENVVNTEYFLHSKSPVIDTKKWIKEKLDKVLVFGFHQSPFDWCAVKLLKTNLLTIKKPINPRSLPIKQAGSLNLDHHTLKNENWDKKRDMCVVDFILWKYGQRKGFIKQLKTNKGTQQEQDEAVEYYSTHQDTFCYGNYEFERNAGVSVNPNETGYTIDHIEQFCENFEINMICLIDGVIKYHYTTDGAKRNPAFVFEMKNNHLYPICDTYTIQGYTKQIRNIKSNTLQIGVKKEDETKEGKKEDKKINVFKDTSIIHNTKIEYAIKIMERENTQTNYPTDLKLSNNVLNNFELNGKRFLFNEKDNELTKDIMKYCDDNGVDYVGQSPQTFTHQNLIEFNEEHTTYLNTDVRDALCSQQVKDRTHRGICVSEDEFFDCYDEAECFDMNKQYRYAMENPLENFMTIDFTDTIQEVNNDFINYEDDEEEEEQEYNTDEKKKVIPFGLYYVRTSDKTLFFGNNFYSSATITEAKKLEIKFYVEYFIKGTPITDLNIFKKIIDEIAVKYAKYPLLTKQIINSIYGMMAKTKNKNATLKVDTDINRVYESYAVEKGREGKSLYVENVKTETGKEYFVYGDKTEREMMNHNLPISIQIQDFANIYFNRMTRDIGGKVLWRKTDCAMIYKPENVNTSNEVGGYDYHTKPVRESLKMDYDRHYTYFKPHYEWDMMKENDSDDWEKIIENVKNNGGGMVSGRAGTGKSFVIINGMKYLEEHYNIKSQALAFTNKATIQLDGKTIDSFLRLDKDGKVNKKWAYDVARGIGLAVVDEISMIGKARWKILSEFKMLTGIPFMLLGDDRQLPPVETDDGDTLQHNILNNHTEILDDMKDSILTIEDLITGTNITYLNRTRQKINSIVQDAIKPDDAVYIEFDSIEGAKYHQDAYIFKDAKLIMWITPKCKTFKKNECVKVIEINGDMMKVSNGKDEMSFEIKDFHKIFLLGYATTIHKSQGDTCDGVVNIFDTYFMTLRLSRNNTGIDWFNHPVIYSLCNGLKCELTQMKRYDIDLWNKLETICESDIGGRKGIYTAISRARKYENVKIRNIEDFGKYNKKNLPPYLRNKTKSYDDYENTFMTPDEDFDIEELYAMC